MSRITREEVHAAARALNAKGVKPTTIKVREALGKGSYSTIGKHLEEWDAPEEAQAEAPDVPESLAALLPGIWAACYAEAETILKARADEAQEALGDCLESLQSAQAATDQAEEQIEALQAQLAEARAQIQAASADCQHWREKAEVAEARADAERRRGDEMKADRETWTDRHRESQAELAEAKARLAALEASTRAGQKAESPEGKKAPQAKGRRATAKQEKQATAEALEKLGQQRID